MQRYFYTKFLTVLICSLFALNWPVSVEGANKKSPSNAATTPPPPPPPPEPEAIIEEINAKQLDKLLNEKDYVAVFWYARTCLTCDNVLAELEKIDDDTDDFGVDFVKINDKRLAKQYGIKTFPALTYFREKEPIIYDGDLMDEEGVLDFLTSLEAMDLPDRIEEVNAKILMKIIEDTDFVAVLFCPDHATCPPRVMDKPQCRKCAKALQELENIDDEADQLGIGFVKIHDESLAEEYNLGGLPALVYYRHQTPIIYEGELQREEDVLEWLVQNKSTGDEDDVIEDVTPKTLATLISNIDNLVVLFYDHNNDDSMTVLEELEQIDDDCDKHGIQFVKIDDAKTCEEFGIDRMPAIVYFEKQIPNIYDGDLMDEEQILQWLISQLEHDEIEDVTDEMLDKMVKEGRVLAVLFYDNNDEKSERVLEELENIDDECDQLGITFVKIDNPEEALEYGITEVPKLIYFEKGIPTIYEGNLEQEEKLLHWLEEQTNSDQIEDITDEMLDIIIEKMTHVAVLFYDKDQKKSQKVLSELENIDDECDANDIAFVKIDDDTEAKEYGIDELPALVLFERGIPHVYDGDLMKEDELLGWLVHQKRYSDIPEVTDEMKDKLVENIEYLAVIFYDKDDKQDIRVLNELENIDDELEKEGIVIVRIDNPAEAQEYGLDHLPSLIYYENRIPALYEGDLMNEDEVLDWLILQKKTATIEEVTDEMLANLISEHEFVVVFFTGACDPGDKCDRTLTALETIDDELDEAGIIFVTTEDTAVAKKYNIKNYPLLVFFRNRDPLVFSGDLEDEDEVLTWITDEETLEIPGRIEEVNAKMLDKMLAEKDHVVVFFYVEGDKKSQRILNELENIDDECEEKSIDFVKTSDEDIDKEYDLASLPALAFYRHKFRTIYNGDLMKEEEILEWVIELHESTADVIESVDRKTLQVLIQDVEHLAVFFYTDNCASCAAILEELENIDDDTDKHGIQFVKSNDVKLAHEIGIFAFPTLVYYDTGVPIMYDGNLKNENRILQWLINQRNDECFYVGLLGQDGRHNLVQHKNKPFQCCPTHLDKSSKVPTMTVQHLKFSDSQGSSKSKDQKQDIATRHTVTSGKRLHESKEKIVSNSKRSLRNHNSHVVDDDDDDDDKILKSVSQTKHKSPTYNTPKREHIQQFASKVKAKKAKNAVATSTITKIDKNNKKNDKIHGKIGDGTFDFRDIGNSANVFKWILGQKAEESIPLINRDQLTDYLNTKDFLAVVFYKEDDPDAPRVLRHIELIDDEASEYGIYVVKMNDKLMAKKYGFRNPPGITYFRKGKYINYDGDMDDEEEILDWLTSPANMEMTDHIEQVNRKMFEKIRKTSDYLAVIFYSDDCKQCPRVLAEVEHIDDDADKAGIDFVKIDDKQMAKEYGVFALPAIVFFKPTSKEPVIYAGDLYEEEQILTWLLTQKDPSGDVIEDLEGERLIKLIDESGSIAVYFWNKTQCDICNSKAARKARLKKEKESQQHQQADNSNDASAALDSEAEMGAESSETSGDGKHEDDLDGCEQCTKVLEELENIDDDCDKHGIIFVKTKDFEVAESYGVHDYPALVYFEGGIPNVFEGALKEEEEVLQWLITQKTEDRIELITRQMLETMVEETQYLAVYFLRTDRTENQPAFCRSLCSPSVSNTNLTYAINSNMSNPKYKIQTFIENYKMRKRKRIENQDKLKCNICDQILEGLELIDDECDVFGIHMVKIQDPQLAKRYSIKTFPALVYFRNGNPLIFEGDLQNEQSVLEWLIDDDNRELADEIEEVNERMLERLMSESTLLVVFFYDEECAECEDILEELEEIDGEADLFGIDFVKIASVEAAKKYEVVNIPSLVYFRKQVPVLYDGDLHQHDKIITWLTSQDVFEIKNEIEEVNRKMLDKLLEENEFLTVFFYEHNQQESTSVLEKLENIDSETDNLDITFVKMADSRYAKKWGVTKLPAIVYFRRRFPSIYRGDLLSEEEVLEWLRKNRFRQPELNLFMYALIALAVAFVLYTAFLLQCFKPTQPPSQPHPKQS